MVITLICRCLPESDCRLNLFLEAWRTPPCGCLGYQLVMSSRRTSDASWPVVNTVSKSGSKLKYKYTNPIEKKVYICLLGLFFWKWCQSYSWPLQSLWTSVPCWRVRRRRGNTLTFLTAPRMTSLTLTSTAIYQRTTQTTRYK